MDVFGADKVLGDNSYLFGFDKNGKIVSVMKRAVLDGPSMIARIYYPNGNLKEVYLDDDDFVTGRTPASENTLGFDIFRLDIKNPNQELIPNNATSLDLNYTRSRDRYYLYLTALEIENNPKEITQLYRSTRVTKLTAKDTEKGYYVIVGVFLNINNVEKRVEEMKNWGYEAKVYYNKDQVLNFIYVDRFDKYEDAMKKVDEIRQNTEIPDPWILDVANYE